MEEKSEFQRELAIIEGELVGDVTAQEVRMNQSGASHISASKVEMNQSGAEVINSEKVEARQSLAIAVRAKECSFEESRLGFIQADKAEISSSTVGVAFCQSIRSQNGRAFLVLAREVAGSMETVLDGSTAFKFGLGVGLAFGIVSILRSFFKKIQPA